MANAPKTAAQTKVAPAVDPKVPEPEATEPSPELVEETRDLVPLGTELVLRTANDVVIMDPMTGKHFDITSDTKVTVNQFLQEKLASGELVEA